MLISNRLSWSMLGICAGAAVLAGCGASESLAPTSPSIVSSNTAPNQASPMHRASSLPSRVLYGGGLCETGRYYTCNNDVYGVFVFDATDCTASCSKQYSPLYFITNGITQGGTGRLPVAVDDKGNLYVANDSDPSNVLIYPPGALSPSATLGGLPSGWPTVAIAVSNAGEIAVGSYTNDTVYTYDPGSSTPSRTITCDSGYSGSSVASLAYNKSGALYIGINSTGSAAAGYIYQLAKNATKCGKKPKASTAGFSYFGSYLLGDNSLVAWKDGLLWLGQTFGLLGFPKPHATPVPYDTSNWNWNSPASGLAVDKAGDVYIGIGQDSGAILTWCAGWAPKQKKASQCPPVGFGTESQYPASVAVYPRAPLSKW